MPEVTVPSPCDKWPEVMYFDTRMLSSQLMAGLVILYGERYGLGAADTSLLLRMASYDDVGLCDCRHGLGTTPGLSVVTNPRILNRIREAWRGLYYFRPSRVADLDVLYRAFVKDDGRWYPEVVTWLDAHMETLRAEWPRIRTLKERVIDAQMCRDQSRRVLRITRMLKHCRRKWQPVSVIDLMHQLDSPGYWASPSSRQRMLVFRWRMRLVPILRWGTIRRYERRVCGWAMDRQDGSAENSAFRFLDVNKPPRGIRMFARRRSNHDRLRCRSSAGRPSEQ